MWIIEKASNGEYYWPINIDKLIYISNGKDSSINNYYIKFHLIDTSNVKWLFDSKKEKNEYLDKIMKALPRLNTGIGEVSL